VTWREALSQATRDVRVVASPENIAARRRLFQAAYDAGLTIEQIADGGCLASRSSVASIIGRQGHASRRSLDDEVPAGCLP
jgi:hypothetical protein